MMDNTHETRTVAGGGPLEHLQVTIGITEGENGTAASMLNDSNLLAGAVINEVNSGKRISTGLPSHLEQSLAAAADDLLGRNTVYALRPRPHICDADAGHDEGFEPFSRKYATSSSIG
jgi:hypothetical protein